MGVVRARQGDLQGRIVHGVTAVQLRRQREGQ
jgi:hypothetical protein